MTENEIIKALKCCGDESNCKDCPCHDKRFENHISCAEELMKSAAELIEKQKAENKDLKYSLGCSKASREWLKQCIETLKEKVIKEFAERLKKETIFISDSIDRSTMLIVIDALLEELTGHKETTVSLIDGHIEGSDV